MISEYHKEYEPPTLLQRIERMIKDYGGRLRLVFYLEQEWKKPLRPARRNAARAEKVITYVNQCKWTEHEIKFLVRNKRKMTCITIAKKLNRTPKSVQAKYTALVRDGYV